MTERMTVEQAAECSGCWIDGARGWTASARVVEIAQECGMGLDADDQLILESYLASENRLILSTGADVDVVECVIGQGELMDKAEEWLNDKLRAAGLVVRAGER